MSEETNHLKDLVPLQRQRWASGDHVLVEDLISQSGQLDGSAEDLMDLIYAEVLLREEAGEEPTELEYCQRFPDVREAICRQFQVHRALSDHAPASFPSQHGPSPDADSMPQLPTVPGFETVGTVGRGTGGVVLEAVEEALNRRVAIKLLAGGDVADETQRTKLVREAEATASLQHPSIVRVHQVGETNGAPFIVMEFVVGGSLATRLRGGPLAPKSAVTLAIAIANAIHHAHENDIVHRDIKPGNILLDTAGNPKICDFGLARRLKSDQSLHATGEVVGTPAYMAPEQARGEKADERADVYAIGAVLYEMLSGRSPFQAASSWEILNQIMTIDVVPLRRLNSAIPKDLETICAKCLEKSTSRRYQTARQLHDELQRFASGKSIQARPVGAITKVAKWCARNKRVATLAVTSLVLLLALGIGSTIAAFRLAAANDSIREEQENARVAQASAEQDRTAAMDALNLMVDSLYEDLSRDAASVKTQQKVLDAAISGLQSITTVAGDRAQATTRARAYQRIAELLSLQNKNAEATAYYNKAIDIARDQLKSQPDNTTYKRSLSISLGMLATHCIGIRKVSEARPLTVESNTLAQQVLAALPDDVKSLRQLVTNHLHTMDAGWFRMDDQSVLDYGKTALADAEKLVKLSPNDHQSLTVTQSLHFRVGRSYLQLGDVASAETHFDAARTYLDVAIGLEPDRTELRSASAALTRAHGLAAQSRGDILESKRLLEQGLREFVALSDADPDDQRVRQQVANSNSLLANAYYALGEYNDSAKATENAAVIYAKLLDGSPENDILRVLIAEAYFKQANAQLGLNDWAAAGRCYTKVRRYLSDPEFGDALEGGAAAAYIAMSAPLLEGTLRAQGATAEQKTTTGECVALMLISRAAAFEGTQSALPPKARSQAAAVIGRAEIETFADLFQYIESIENVIPFVSEERPTWQARTLAIKARRIAESDDSSTEEVTQSLAQAIAVVRKRLKTVPNALAGYSSEPDLRWLVQHPQFKAQTEESSRKPEKAQ